MNFIVHTPSFKSTVELYAGPESERQRGSGGGLRLRSSIDSREMIASMGLVLGEAWKVPGDYNIAAIKDFTTSVMYASAFAAGPEEQECMEWNDVDNGNLFVCAESWARRIKVSEKEANVRVVGIWNDRVLKDCATLLVVPLKEKLDEGEELVAESRDIEFHRDRWLMDRIVYGDDLRGAIFQMEGYFVDSRCGGGFSYGYAAS